MKNVRAHAVRKEDEVILKMTMSFLVTPLLFLVIAGAVVAA